MRESDLDVVLAWRNHPDIRRYMYTQDQITNEQHQNWFQSAAESADKELLIFEVSGHPQGFIQFSSFHGGPVAEWGFYSAPNAPGGSGKRMGQAALRYAFEELAYEKVFGQALAYNTQSIRFHHKLGFHQEGVLRKQYYDGQAFHDVYCYGLLRSEWEELS